MPSSPSKNGYSFGGWFTAQNGGGSLFTGSTPVSASITVYAHWTAGATTTYTVTFNAEGGSFTEGGTEQTRTVSSGSSVGASTMPSNPVRTGYTFNGWYTEQNRGGSEFTGFTTVSRNITLYADWTVPIPVPAATLGDALVWLIANAAEGGAYILTLTGDETISPQSLSYNGKKVRITLNGGAAERTVSLGSTGSLFTIESGVTLTLDNNLTLQCYTTSQVRVNSGGTLVMNDGSKISRSAVVVSNGTFTMNGGEISGNTATSYRGGGVYVSNGAFTMNGGEISGSTASDGGGVYVSTGTFTMNGGEISGNTTSYGGGGVYVYGTGTFIKQSDGTIYGSDASDPLKNTAGSDGHAVGGSKKRNTTAGSGVTLDSRLDGFAGGWE
ncbi:hypothetical protein Holit_02737 [Hollandina sp. SP2]